MRYKTMPKYCIAKIVKPFGIHGDLKVQTYTDSCKLQTYSALITHDGTVVSFSFVKRINHNTAILRITDVFDRNTAESLIGLNLYIPKDAIPLLDQDSFYYDDLKGMQVVEKNEHKTVGIVHSVHNYGAGDFLEIQSENATYTLPFNKDAVCEVILKSMTIVIDPCFLIA